MKGRIGCIFLLLAALQHCSAASPIKIPKVGGKWNTGWKGVAAKSAQRIPEALVFGGVGTGIAVGIQQAAQSDSPSYVPQQNIYYPAPIPSAGNSQNVNTGGSTGGDFPTWGWIASGFGVFGIGGGFCLICCFLVIRLGGKKNDIVGDLRAGEIDLEALGKKVRKLSRQRQSNGLI